MPCFFSSKTEICILFTDWDTFLCRLVVRVWKYTLNASPLYDHVVKSYKFIIYDVKAIIENNHSRFSFRKPPKINSKEIDRVLMATATLTPI